MFEALIILALYVCHIFLMRYLDLWASKNWGKDPQMINHSPTPMLWFVPIIGTCLILLTAFAAWYGKWRTTSSGKWFLGNNINK